MINKKGLYQEINEYLQKYCTQKDNINKIQVDLIQAHHYPRGKSAEILMGIKPLREVSEEELYWIAVALNDINRNTNTCLQAIDLEQYFTNKEKTSYKNSQWIEESNEIYPVVFNNLIRVSVDQWVGVLDIDTICDLYNAQIINYNKNTQRNLIRRERNGSVSYHINLKQKSVKEIQSAMHKKTFIPNDLSFNLNLDNEELEYEVTDNSIVITKGQVDIIDGYHRFRAMIKEKEVNPEFNYTTIVNFMNFDEMKANSYIAQQDKRNKIDKQFVKSLDANNPVYLTVARLNEDATSYLYGYIGRGLHIENAYLFELISELFKITDRKEAILVAKHIKNVVNSLVDDEAIEVEKITPASLALIIRGCSLYNNELESAKLIKKGLQKIDQLGEDKFKLRRVTKPLIKYLDSFISSL